MSASASSRKIKALFPWLVVAIICALVLYSHLELRFDLNAFLPKKEGIVQSVISEQMTAGPGSRMLFVGISGGSREDLEESSRRVVVALSDDDLFQNVHNGEFDDTHIGIPEPINTYYLLLGRYELDKAQVLRAAKDRAGEVALAGQDLMALVSRDPMLQSVQLLQNIAIPGMDGDPWFSEGEQAVVVTETRASAIDIKAQAKAIGRIHAAFEKARANPEQVIDITGVGAFSVELQDSIRSETRNLTIAAVVAILLVLFIAYRRPLLLLLAGLPLGLGFLVALTVLSVVFDSIHGITLAFGFTLMGVAIDYPVHLFSHARAEGGNRAITAIWPTLRLGAVSTMLAYLAIALAGNEGLAQLGLFSISGVLVAVLVTRFCLPELVDDSKTARSQTKSLGHRSELAIAPAAFCLLGAAAALYWFAGDKAWQDDLSSLSPVPAERLAADRELRAATGAANLRHQLMLHDDSADEVLERSAQLDDFLGQAVQRGDLGDWRSASQVLRSTTKQQATQKAIPAPERLSQIVAQAVEATPFRAGTFEPFIEAAANSKTLSPLTPEGFAGTPLESWLETRLFEMDGQWVALVSLVEPSVEPLRAALEAHDQNVYWVDLRQASIDQMTTFRQHALRGIGAASVLILLVLSIQCRDARRVGWLLLTIAATLGLTALAAILIQHQLTIIHLVAMVLVLGLGLDYGLFLSRGKSGNGGRPDVHAVTVCAASTALAFAILVLSSVPLLQFLGLTVSVGVATGYTLARIGSAGTARS